MVRKWNNSIESNKNFVMKPIFIHFCSFQTMSGLKRIDFYLDYFESIINTTITTTAQLKVTILRTLLCLFVKNGSSPTSFSFIFVFSNKY